MNKTIVVFGATGKVGCYTCLHLKEKGFNVIAVGRRSSDNGFFSGYGISYISLDILNQKEFEKLPRYHIFGIVHLAAALPATMNGYNPHYYVSLNLDGTLNVLDYAVKVGVKRFVFPKSWSDVQYLTGSLRPIPADAEVHYPLNDDHTVYAITKNAACDIIHHYAVKFNFKYYILRFPNIFCYHPNPTFYKDGIKRWQGMWAIIEQAKKGEDIELWGDPNAARDFFYVKDCTQIVEKSLSSNGESGIYNVGTGRAINRLEQIKGIIEVFSPKGNPSNIIYAPDKPSAPFYLLDISKTIEQLGYQPQYDYISSLLDIKKEMESERFALLWGKREDYV